MKKPLLQLIAGLKKTLRQMQEQGIHISSATEYEVITPNPQPATISSSLKTPPITNLIR